MNRGATHHERDIQPGDFHRVDAATAEHFERCNACRYPFKKREAQIDMNDFRSHKCTCTKAAAR